MAVLGNGSKAPESPRPNGAQKSLPGLPAPAASSQNKQQESEADKRKREMRERIEKAKKEREEKEAKAKAEAKPEPKPEPKKDDKADAEPAQTAPVDATMRRFEELLRAGGFTRRLTWRQRRALRKIERRCDRVRTALHDAFAGTPPEGVMRSMDSLAALEAVARLEMLCEPGPTSSKR